MTWKRNGLGEPEVAVEVPGYMGADILTLADRTLWAVVQADPGTLAERPGERKWLLWEPGEAPVRPKALEPVMAPMERGVECSAVVGADGGLYVMTASNARSPGVVSRWEMGTDVVGALRGPAVSREFSASVPPEKPVVVAPERVWSTAGVVPEGWIFSPRLRLVKTSAAPGGVLMGTMESADGRTAVVEIDPRTLEAKDGGFLDAPSVDATVVSRDGEAVLLYRAPDAGWDAYSDDAILSFSRGGQLLPVRWAGRKDGEGWSERTDHLVGVVGVPVYAFDVAPKSPQTLWAAYVLGERFQPTLLVFAGAGSEISALPLTRVLEGEVVRLRIAARGRGVDVCVVFRVDMSFRVEFHHLVW
jgi:hypothetical protein